MLGYCMVCNELRTIRKGSQKWGSRQYDYYPVTHWVNVHRACGALVDFPDPEQEYPPAVCRVCGPVGLDFESIMCSGDKRVIK